jgi:hypothetical protein
METAMRMAQYDHKNNDDRSCYDSNAYRLTHLEAKRKEIAIKMQGMDENNPIVIE